MKVVIRLTKEEELKALPLLLRHSSGTALSNRTYILESSAAAELLTAGIEFSQIPGESNVLSEEILIVERDVDLL